MKHAIILVVLITGFNLTTYAQKTYQKNYDSKNRLISEGWLDKNQKVDSWHFYYPNGNITKEGHFASGVATKYWRFYAKNGNLKMEGHFENGKKTDWWLFYDNMEKVNHKCQLKNNKKNGYCLMYDNEKLIAASKYKAGKKINEWTTFASFKKENSLSDLQ